MKIYISGVMQGSINGKGLQEQGYRQVISDAVKILHPNAEIYDPFSIFPDSVEFNNQRAKQTLFAMAEEVASSDIVIAYLLPEASMGTALEMVRAYDSSKTFISISTFDRNWFNGVVSAKIFISLDEIYDWIQQTDFTELIRVNEQIEI